MSEFSWEIFTDILDDDNAQKPNDSEINKIRNEIYKQCRERCCEPKGFFKLYAPTGGGKTLSGMRFVAGHAKTHKMDRIIYYCLTYLSLNKTRKFLKTYLTNTFWTKNLYLKATPT